MTKDAIKKIVEAHEKWLRNEDGGELANLERAHLKDAHLEWANLERAHLERAHLEWANLEGANLERAHLEGAHLEGAHLEGANLEGANLKDAHLEGANLERAHLERAHLEWANLERAHLKDAHLEGANLEGANLKDAHLEGANLSGATGILSPINFMEARFERVDAGYVVYKTFGSQYASPDNWKIEPGSIISETVNTDRGTSCGSGINVAPLSWVKKEYPGKPIWKLLIKWEWLPGVVVPYGTDGKIRCEKAMLMEQEG